MAIHAVFYSPLSKTGLFPVAIHAVFYSPLSKIRLFSSGYSRCVLCHRSLKLDSCYVHTVFSSPLSKSGLLLQWLFTLCSVHLCLRLDFFFQWLCHLCLKLHSYPVSVSPLSKTKLLLHVPSVSSFVCLISPTRCPPGKVRLTSRSLLSFVKHFLTVIPFSVAVH